MNQDQINRDLSEKEASDSKFQTALLSFVSTRLTASSSAMGKHWERWDKNAELYRGYMPMDMNDEKALAKKEPPKIIVPIAYAQIQTAVSFLFSSFTQKDNIYEITGNGPEDVQNALAMEMDLSYQLRKDKFPLKLYLWLVDTLRFGFGVVKSQWKEDHHQMRTQQQQINKTLLDTLLGRPGTTTMVEQVMEVLTFQGNHTRNISPYSFYPDPDVPIGQFQDGSFVGHEEQISRAELLRQQEDGIFFGVEKIKADRTRDLIDGVGRRRPNRFNDSIIDKSLSGDTEAAVFVLEVQVDLVPKDWSEKYDIDIGKETYPCRYIVTIGNDSKPIRFEKFNFYHGQFTYDVMEYSPDSNNFYNPGMSDTINELQGIVSWLFNSHIANVRSILYNRFLVDESKVMIEDIREGRQYIRVKSPNGDLNRVIKEISTQDVTRGNISDVSSVTGLIQMVTGVNDNAMGQYNGGRRSGTEARNVSIGQASRLKMHALLNWNQGMAPLGEKFLSNTRQGRTKEVYQQIVGDLANNALFENVIYADPNKIAGGYDFAPFDATVPSEKGYQASLLQEILTTLLTNPQTIQLTGLDPVKLLEYIAQLYGIKNLKDFQVTNQGLQTPGGQPIPQPQTQVVPNEQAQSAIAQGAQPVPNTEDLIASLLQGGKK